MDNLCVRIGEHVFQIDASSQRVTDYIHYFFQVIHDDHFAGGKRDLLVHIEDGYGRPFEDFSVDVSHHQDQIRCQRADYLIEMDTSQGVAYVYVHDEFALKHALMNLYSEFIVFHSWGLLIHSSCVINQGVAHLFAGKSGAGKSTVAGLSRPRPLLSDEATVVRISDKEVTVFDSPFRSDTRSNFETHSYELTSINLLCQSTFVSRMPIAFSTAMLELIDKVFYWPGNAQDITKATRLVRSLAKNVPVFMMHFQKNAIFWEAIL